MLPGGFSLPLALAVEELIICEQEPVETEYGEGLALDTADRYVGEQMISGRVLSRVTTVERGSDTIKLRVGYVCTEMIGTERSEELDIYNGKDH